MDKLTDAELSTLAEMLDDPVCTLTDYWRSRVYFMIQEILRLRLALEDERDRARVLHLHRVRGF